MSATTPTPAITSAVVTMRLTIVKAPSIRTPGYSSVVALRVAGKRILKSNHRPLLSNP